MRGIRGNKKEARSRHQVSRQVKSLPEQHREIRQGLGLHRTTSRALVAVAVAVESRAQLLTHAPQWVLRSVVDAAAVIVVVLAHPSSSAEQAAGADTDADADALVRQACAAMLRCSVRDSDLPHRGSVLMETFWAVRHLVAAPPPPYPRGPAPSAWPDRLGAGVTFWCLERFRLGLRAAQSSTDRVNKALDLIRMSLPPLFPAAPRHAAAWPH